MAQFLYKAKISPNVIKEGIIEAETKIQAISKLEKQGLFPIRIEKKEIDSTLPLSFRGVGPRAIAIFTRQLANLLESGLTLLSGLDILDRQVQSKSLKLVVGGLIDDLKDGEAFSHALMKYPKIFSPLYVALIHSAEASGTIDSTLTRLADFMERQLDLKSKIKTSMAYPVFILLVGVATVFLLMYFVVPKLLVVFTEFSQSLPLSTQILITATNFIRYNGWIILLLGAVLVISFFRIKRNPEIKLALDKLKVNIPLLKDFEIKTEIGSFCRSMSILIENGVELLTALEITENIITNQYLRVKIRDLREEVKDGASLTKVMQESEFMPSFAASIINIGEETGTLSKALARVSDTYEKDLDKVIKTFVDLLGPVMILLVGLVIGFIVIAMLLPIFQLNIIAG